MNPASATLAKLVGVVIYLCALLLIGAVASRRMRDMRDYFAGGKTFGYWAAALSARATGESAWLLLGLTGMGAMVGAKALWVVVGETLGVGTAWLVMCRRFKRLTDRYDSITVPDYLEDRFRDAGHKLRLISAGALAVFVTIYVSAQIDATGKAFETFLGINYFAGAIIGFGVVLVYIVSGGFVAVVWSDVFQGLLMLMGLLLLPIAGTIHAGGPGAVVRGLSAIDPGLLSLAGPTGWTPLNLVEIAGLALIGLGFLGSPQIFVRFLSLSSVAEIKPGSVVAISYTIITDTFAVLTGLVGRMLLTGPGVDPTTLGSGAEDVLPELVELLMPPLMVGLFIAVVLSAIMSTIDSLLVVAGSAAVRDWYQKVKHPEMTDRRLMSLSRRATAGLALIALGVALTVAVLSPSRTVFWFVVFGWSGIAATFCPTIILSLAWKDFTARGALVAMASGFACVPFFKFAAPHLPGVGTFFTAMPELPPAFLISGALGVLVSLGDARGRQAVAGVEEELAEAGAPLSAGDIRPQPTPKP